MKRYIRRSIFASLKQLADGDVLLTDYAGDIVNLLVNKPKPYRIVYNDIDDVYLIADAHDYLHLDMIQIALDEGYTPKSAEFMKKYGESAEYFDSNRTVNLVFLPTENIGSFGDYPDIYYTMEFGYEFPITTGSVFTKDKFTKNYFKKSAPELYSKLQKYAIDENRIFEEYLW
jgi:hypothetical protein